MSEEWQGVVWSLGVGVSATLFMDGVAWLRAGLLGQRGLDWALVGRWLGHLARGQLVLPSAQAASPVPFERALGWSFHYGVGVGLAGLLWWLLPQEGLDQPPLLLCVGFDLATVLLPMLTLQPGLGMGLAARRAPQPWLARRRSLQTHLTFGVGLYLGAELVAQLLG
ncbi:DUF2938 family protein [Phaeobacter sp. 11ANDIMAR09]|uniref:DUF2938 family protein n=1 Tax=Phaeobacter sp. 11ANDIMAR09 TaxID=1225647 RepID=UPI0006C8403F|nr:DUF2938 family protein [Phaeobacter sp. 11ANDIMAR09]KPD13107.1 hypothetical protein AN476_07345 [Phaeobacter sp. 11ANDIMAR09]